MRGIISCNWRFDADNLQRIAKAWERPFPLWASIRSRGEPRDRPFRGLENRTGKRTSPARYEKTARRLLNREPKNAFFTSPRLARPVQVVCNCHSRPGDVPRSAQIRRQTSSRCTSVCKGAEIARRTRLPWTDITVRVISCSGTTMLSPTLRLNTSMTNSFRSKQICEPRALPDYIATMETGSTWIVAGKPVREEQANLPT